MAIKIHDYFVRYRSRSILFVTLIQLVAAALAGGFLWLVWQQNSDGALNFAITVAATVAAINLVFTPIIWWAVNHPTRTLTQAIAHISKDPVVTPPPKLSASDERTGLKALVQTVYELAIATNPKTADQTVGTNAGAVKPTAASDFFQTVADLTPCGIIVINKQGTITYANTAAPTSPTPSGSRGIDLIFEQNNSLGAWLSDARANKVRDTHQWFRVGDKLPGEPDRRIFDIIGYYQKNDASDIEVVLVTFDRTAVYINDQEDMDFIALAAHELRGPITVIRGYLDVFNQELAPKLTADEHMLLERLQVSAERLAGYVNNILNVSRYDRHQFTLHPQEESLPSLIQSIGPDLMLRAKTQNRSLVFKVSNDLPTIAADSSSLGEVITNLVDNAIKYSHDGGQITVGATPKENWVEITVQDQGIGMPSNIVGNLFTRFYRSHHSRQQVGGTGLGLYICKTIVDAHGGSIWVRSVEGQGTTFGFTMPTYASVADRLQSGNNSTKGIVRRPEGWIKNHAMYRN